MKPLDKIDIEDILALTPVQQGILFHYLKEPGSDRYFEQLSLEISGEIDIKGFERTWNFVIATNEMLRAIFRWKKLENPIQIILKKYHLQSGYYDLTGKESREKKEQVEKIKSEDRKKKFDLREVPFRVTLCKLAAEQYVMIISNHHILYDGWSNGIILREFFQAYHAVCRGDEFLPPEPAAKTKFKEYVKWITNQDKTRQKEYWTGYLKGMETGTRFPLDAAGPFQRSQDGAGTGFTLYHTVLSNHITGKLEEFVKKYKVTTASLLYSAWGILLHRYTDRDDVLFGTTVSGRSVKIKDIENIVGLFINTPPLRVTTPTSSHHGNGKEKILHLLQRINETLQQREVHECTPLVDIKNYSQVADKQEMFNTIVVFENYPLDRELTRENRGLSLQSYSMVDAPNYDLTISFLKVDVLEVTIVYPPGGMNSHIIAALWRHLHRIIAHMIANPEQRVEAVDMLPDEDKKQLLYDFNDTAAEYPQHKTIHRLFQDQVRRTPDKPAVIFADNRFDYDELNREANRVAYQLRLVGVKAGTIVGILLVPSFMRVVAMLAILKAGGAYLPMDPGFPLERLVTMLEDCQAPVVISDNSTIGIYPFTGRKESQDFFSPEILMLDEIGDLPGQTPGKNPAPLANSGDPAYVMYTSGSTGKPKGVIIEHGSVVNNLNWFGKAFNLDERTNLLQLADYTFDPSVEDIFGSLVHGAALYLSDKDLILDRERFRRFIRDNNIHIIDHVPTMLDELLGTGERLKSLRAVITGGMRLEEAVKDRLLEKGYPLYNNYGPTEITVDAMFTRCSREKVTLGKPIFNTRCYIFDTHLRLVPIGVVGELFIAGAGVSRGYLNNPELTARKFDHDLWDYQDDQDEEKRSTNEKYNKKFLRGGPGRAVFLKRVPPGRRRQKIYKTGDMGRWLPDGSIEFSGRIDRQVKVRGNRVELSEIEVQMRRHDCIKDVVVRTMGQEGDITLCAYLVPMSADAVSGRELKEYLSLHLPDYMVPTYFLFLDAFPLTPGGKVDIRALPGPGKEAGNKFDYAPPQDRIEEKLQEIWSGILERPSAEIGIDDDFFKLGGHSLRATKLISRVHKDMNIKVSIMEIFDRPTIRSLAQYIKETEENRFISIQPVEEREYYPVSPAQKRMFIVNRFKGEDISDNATEVLLVEGELDKLRFETVFKRLVKRHQAFRTSFEIIKDEPVQRIHAPGEVEFAIEYYDSNRININVFPDYFVRPFDLGKAPLIRTALIRCPGQEHILVMDIHHIIWDGASKLVIMKDLECLSRGKELPALALQYKDFSSWQKQIVQTGMIRKQEEYWIRLFTGKPPRLDLPTDFQRPPVQSFQGDSIETQLGDHCCAKVNKLVFESGATHFMVLLAVFYILLSRCGGQEDIIVGTPVVGRPHADLENIIGMFVNMLALRNYPGGEKKFKDFLEEVKNSCSSAYENQDYQFDDLVEKLGIQRDSSRSALFDVVFAIHNRNIRRLSIENAQGKKRKKLTFNNYRLKENKAQFDIVFYVYAGEGITLDFRYCTKLFKPLTAAKMLQRYIEILEQVTVNPEIQLKDINISFDLLAAQSEALNQVEFGF